MALIPQFLFYLYPSPTICSLRLHLFCKINTFKKQFRYLINFIVFLLNLLIKNFNTVYLIQFLYIVSIYTLCTFIFFIIIYLYLYIYMFISILYYYISVLFVNNMCIFYIYIFFFYMLLKMYIFYILYLYTFYIHTKY